MGIGFDPDLVLDALGEIAPEQRGGVLEGRLQRPDDAGHDGQGDHLVHGVGDPEAGHDRLIATHDDVDGGADQEGRCEVEDLVEHRAGRRQPHPPPVAPGGPQELLHVRRCYLASACPIRSKKCSYLDSLPTWRSLLGVRPCPETSQVFVSPRRTLVMPLTIDSRSKRAMV